MLGRANALGLTPVGPIPNARQMEWYRRERTAFFHFGMNTYTDLEWGDGTESPSLFCPTDLDCRQWIRSIKEAGFGAAILTAKHHDGFCLWPSSYTDHSVKASPYRDGKGDIVREFTDACREYGVKAGLYLSPWDRHEPTWGSEAYNDFYVGQLTELLTRYGKIREIWWDGAGSQKCRYDWKRWADTVRTLQPDAVIFGSLGAAPYVDVRWVGNERGIAGKPCFSTIDPKSLEVEIPLELNRGKEDGTHFIPAEVDVSIRPGWFYHSEQDAEVRSAANLTELWFCSVGRNAGLLLNLPPDRRGLLCERDVASLKEFGRSLKDMFRDNLADTACVTADSVRAEACAPEKILCREEKGFYAPADDNETPELTFAFDHEIEINAMTLSEVIELGHRVFGFSLLAKADGEWRTLCEGSCVGYRCVERFDTVRTREVKLRITRAKGAPLLHSFGLYLLPALSLADAYSQYIGKNLLATRSARIKREGNTLDIHLGGIRPFNLLRLTGTDICRMEIEVFNGTDFEPTLFAENGEYRFRCMIDHAYRLRVKVPGCAAEEVVAELFCDPEN